MKCPYCDLITFVEIDHLLCYVRYYCPEHGLVSEVRWDYDV